MAAVSGQRWIGKVEGKENGIPQPHKPNLRAKKSPRVVDQFDSKGGLAEILTVVIETINDLSLKSFGILVTVRSAGL